MLELDGSLGEGGGQILRTALTLSMATSQPFHLSRIRAGRRRPGLMRQHLMCVEASTAICGATTQGAGNGSQDLVFHPQALRPGDYRFHIATAGSTTLVFQTVAPMLLLGGKTFTLDLGGGTHNSAAPCLDFLAQTYLPCLRAMGIGWDMQVERRGYYPVGGGHWRITLTPPPAFLPLQLLARGPALKPQVRILITRMAMGIAERERRILASGLGLSEEEIKVEDDPSSVGPGNIALITLPCGNLTETITLFGGYGSPIEAATLAAVREAGDFLAHQAPVGMHLADQLLVPLLLGAGGEFITGPLSSHFLTNQAVLEAFAPGSIAVTPEGESRFHVAISSLNAPFRAVN